MRYQWKEAHSSIKDVEIYAPHKEPEALIFAPKDMPQERLWEIADTLKRHGFTAEPDMHGEEGVLRVKNFKDSRKLISTLQAENFVDGGFETHQTTLDNKEKSKLRPQQKTGMLYMAGETGIMATGAMRNGWLNGKSLWQTISSGPGKKDIAAGSKWLAAGVLLFCFGAKNPDKQVHYAYDDLLETLEKNNVDLSSDDRSTLRTLAQHSSTVFSNVERVVRDHPLVINSTLQAMGGADAIGAGLHQKRPVTGKPNYFKSASGLSTFVGHTTSLFTDEKTAEEKKDSADAKNTPHHSLIERFNDWRRERKYRLAGSSSLFTAGLRLVSGVQEVRINRDFLARPDAASLPDFTTVNNAKIASKMELGINAVKGLASYYYALAGQSVNTDVKKLGILDEIANTVAHMAARRPEGEERTVFVSNVASILATQGNLENSPQEITEAVNQKIAGMHKNRWERPVSPVLAPTPVAQPTPPVVADVATPPVADVAAAARPLPSIVSDGRSAPERMQAPAEVAQAYA